MGELRRRGLFVAIEGYDGVGKTTLCEALKPHYPEAVFVREPGGTLLGEEIRRIIGEEDGESYAVSPLTKLALFNASRAHLLDTVIKPALEAGKLVITDRYYLSTVAYQVGGDGLAGWMVRDAHNIFADGFLPNVTILIEPDLKKYQLLNNKDYFIIRNLSHEDRVRLKFFRFIDSATVHSYILQQRELQERVNAVRNTIDNYSFLPQLAPGS